MNNQNNPQQKHPLNNIPITPRDSTFPIPSHRMCIAPNTHLIGMSHQDLLTEMARCLEGQRTYGFWKKETFHEIIYRGLASYKSANLSSSWTYEGLDKVFGLPLNRNEWENKMQLADGFVLPTL